MIINNINNTSIIAGPKLFPQLFIIPSSLFFFSIIFYGSKPNYVNVLLVFYPLHCYNYKYVKEENMKKKLIVLALCALLISGCGSKIPKLSNGDEAVVTLKDGQMISANELYDAMKEDYALQALINMVDKKILEDKYADQVEDAKASAESQMQMLESRFGDELESLIQQQTGYASKEAYQDSLYLNYLQSKAILDYCKEQIPEKDVKEYYKNEIVGDIKVSHILVTPNVTDDMTDEEKATATTEAKEKIESIISELKKTSKDEVNDKFAELAKEYSMDDTTKDNGGSLGFINKDTLSSSYDELVSAAYKLKDGEYSTSVITTELGYHVILRVESKEKDDLETVRDKILEELANDYYSENPVAALEAIRALRKEYKMEIVDTDIQSDYATLIQNQLNYYQSLNNESN